MEKVEGAKDLNIEAHRKSKLGELDRLMRNTSSQVAED